MLIGLTGYAQHGKDSVATILVRDYGYYRVAFADGLKDLAYAVNPSVPGIGRLQTIVDTDGWDAAKQWPEVRRLLQELGTAARDILGSNVWVEAADRKVFNSPSPVVISDVRFPNEAEYIVRHGGKVFAVHRPGFDNGVGIEHPSEANIHRIPYDRVISNDRTLADLELRVRDIMETRVGVKPWAASSD